MKKVNKFIKEFIVKFKNCKLFSKKFIDKDVEEFEESIASDFGQGIMYF